jgi:RHS repeat-associated protein
LLASTLSAPRASAAVAPAPKPRASAPAASPARQSPARREGELIVRFREGVSDETKSAKLAAKGARVASKARGESRLERVELQEGADAAQAAADLSRDPSVELAEPNYLVKDNQVTPNDPRFAEQWALRNTEQVGGAAGSDINAAAAWRQTTGSPSTIVAVLDGGIDFSHADLKNNKWVNQGETPDNGLDDEGDGFADDAYGWNFVHNTGDAGDEQGHGTSVAGIIAAEGNNRTGVSGVMWRASLMSLKVLDSTGTGDVASAVEAIDYAVAHGAQVVNCSWGTDADSSFLKEAIERAGRKGVVVVASAGNNARGIDASPYYPASYDLPNLITVAATDAFDNLASFSDWGAQRVAVAAPGLDVLTTQQGGDYRVVSGTSAAAPFVSGVAGLIKTLRPNMPAAQVRSAIVSGARQVSALSGKVSSGGVADAAGALASVQGNPYNNGNGGNGDNAGGNGSGDGNGQGNGNGQGYVPPAKLHEKDKNNGRDKNGLTAEAPATVKGAPAAGLPDLNESRKVRISPEAPAASATIHADLACMDCDPGGGGGAGGSDPYFGTSRTEPVNQTGKPGVTLGSRNFNWGLPLVSLPGRAGLDLNVSLFYNSLVWTKQGTTIQYNADHGTPAPGFQLGMPRLQQKFLNTDANLYAYIMVTPSGGRVEMRQTGTAGVYESSDSTYTQLTEGAAPVVRTTDGVQYVFGQSVSGEWRCTQVKDRNGNYISASYDPTTGHVTSITDTLGRQVNFNYNATTQLLETITQTWGGSTHVYAYFYYGTNTVSYSFSGVSAIGLANGSSQTVLTSVALSGTLGAGGALDSYNFDYNSYGQVYRIRHNGPDGHLLAQTTYTFNTSTAQTDCPRFTEQRDWAQYWNGDADDVPASSEEAVTAFSVTNGVQFTHPYSGATMTGSVAQETSPDGTVYKVYSQSSGWGAGLPQLSEIWSNNVKKKWSYNVWTQDNNSLLYAQNPRITESNVVDAEGNRRRVTVEYNAGYGLPTHVREWGGPNADQLLRLSATAYKGDAGYINNRVIGLPYEKVVYDGPTGAVKSREIFQYDWSGNDPWGDSYFSSQAPSTAYTDPGYVTGRGNLVGVVRYDCTNGTTAYDDSKAIWVRRAGYNKAGEAVWTKDALGHKTSVSYADSFSDTAKNALNTLAYPTQITDPEGNSSTALFNYDFGAVTRTHEPVSGTASTGVSYLDVVSAYDSYGRIQQQTNQTNSSYKRWVYSAAGDSVQTFQTVTGVTQADEFYSIQVFDGAGRVRAQAADHPGSSGGYSAVHTIYDNMGRVYQQSNGTEITGSWVPTGDDPAWVYTTQAYDWKSRPTQTTNPDGTTRLISYSGCGCAGGQVSTAQDEHGRQKRYTKDILGRLTKIEELDWSGNVYSTTNNTYDSLDNLTQISLQGQTRTFDYDGYGRLWHRTTPEQGTTTFAYNADDTIASMTDARGAKTVYGYNARQMTTSTSYDLSGVVAGQNVASTATASYTYDAAGNRTSMTDGMGSTTYHYNNLGLMDYEQRAFSGLGTYQISYAYNAGGELTSVTNPWGAQVTYSFDKAGRVSSVGGSGYANVSNYANSISYRAFGSVKGMNFSEGAGRTLYTSYDNRMRLTKWDVSGVLGYKYYYNDFNEHAGRVTYAQSVNASNAGLDRSQTSSPEDRSYEYDHVGRLTYAHSGAEAKAHAIGGPWGIMDGPYSLGFEYDSLSNMTHRYGWGGEVQGGSAGQSSDLYYTHTNNRRNGFSYDNAGNLTFDGGQHFTYDAAGRQVQVDWTDLHQYYDGDGLRVKKTENSSSLIQYYLRSSVLGGQVVAEINYLGGWSRGYVYSGSGLIAVQQGGVFFVHQDPVTKSKRVTAATDGSVQSVVELDPWGADTGHSSNSAFQPHKFGSYERDANGTDEAMFRRYNRWHSRFDQPDPYGGSYDMTNPQSFNRYAYTQNDPVNFHDPTGLDGEPICDADGKCYPWEPPIATVYGSLFGDYFLPAEFGGGSSIFFGMVMPMRDPGGRPEVTRTITLPTNPGNTGTQRGPGAPSPNKLLADCYQDALTAYHAGYSSNSAGSWYTSIVGAFSPFTVTGGTNGVVGAGAEIASRGRVARMWGNTPLVGPMESAASAGTRGFFKGAIGFGGKMLGRVSGVLTAAGAGIQLENHIIGMEAWLRNAISECNKGVDGASGAVTPHIGRDNAGSAQAFVDRYGH